MGKGIYVGGHTKIYLSEDGTVWPAGAHADSGGEETKSLRGATHNKRWADDTLTDLAAEGGRSLLKQEEFIILAEYASSYRTKKPTRVLRSLSPALVASVERFGGVVEWINADEHRITRFWNMVKEQENPSRKKSSCSRSGKALEFARKKNKVR